jgi:hypothetical protein
MGKSAPPPSSVDFSHNEQRVSCYCNDLVHTKEDSGFEPADGKYYSHTLEEQRTARAERQEHLDLRIQIINQQKTIDILLSELSQCKDENEALKANKIVLTEDLDRPINERGIKKRGWFPKGYNSNVGSMQMLVNTNARLMMDNDRLQDTLGTIRADSERRSDENKQRIKTLQQNNETLQQQLKTPKILNSKLSSRRTGKTSPRSFLVEGDRTEATTRSSQHSNQDSTMDSVDSINELYEQYLKIMEGTETKVNNIIVKQTVHRKPMDFIRIWTKEVDGTFANRATSSKSTGLLVEFGETKYWRGARSDMRTSYTLGTGLKQVRATKAASLNM